MKLRVDRELLLYACQSAGAALPAKAVREVTACFRLDAQEDRLTLTAFNMELGIRQEIHDVEVDRPGSVLLPAKQLTQILHESLADQVELEAGSTVTLRCDGPDSSAKFELPQRPVEEFPELPEGNDSQEIVIEGTSGQFREMIFRTLFAAYKREVVGHYPIHSLLWDLDAGSDSTNSSTLRLVGTDGKRLALCESIVTVLTKPSSSGMQLAPLAPVRAMNLLERILIHDNEVVRVCFGANYVRFLTKRTTIYTTLVQGRFPPYRDILKKIENETKFKIPLPMEEFLSAVRQIRVVTDKENRKVDITFQPGMAVLEGRGPDTESGQVELPLPDFAGPEIRVAFDPDFLIDYLYTASGSTADDAQPLPLTLELVAENKPALFYFDGGAPSRWIYLVMPMVTAV